MDNSYGSNSMTTAWTTLSMLLDILYTSAFLYKNVHI